MSERAERERRRRASTAPATKLHRSDDVAQAARLQSETTSRASLTSLQHTRGNAFVGRALQREQSPEPLTDRHGKRYTYAFRIGGDVSLALARTAKELAGDAPLARAQVRRLQRVARDNGGIGEVQRMFLAGLYDADNVRRLSRMRVTAGASIEFPLASIRAGMPQLSAPRPSARRADASLQRKAAAPRPGRAALQRAAEGSFELTSRAGTTQSVAPAAGSERAPAASPRGVPVTPHPLVRRVNQAHEHLQAETAKPRIRTLGPVAEAPRGFRPRALSEAMRRDLEGLTVPTAGELDSLKDALIAEFEIRAMRLAHTWLDRNENVARAEATRYREVSSGDPSSEANQLRAAARDLGTVQQAILKRLGTYNATMAAYGGPQALLTPSHFDDYLEGSFAANDPEIQTKLLPRLERLKGIYGPSFPILLQRNTDYLAIASSHAATLEKIIASTTNDVLTRIGTTRSELTPRKVWRLDPIVEATKQEMGIPLTATTAAGRAIDDYQASLRAEDTFVKMALGALGIALAIGAIIVTGGAAAPGVAGALATAETASALALASAGLGAYSAIEEYEEYRFAHAASGASLDPATALSREDPSLAWLAVAVVGAVLDVGAAVVAFRNLAAVARAAHTAEGMLALEEAARAQARVLRREGRLAGMTEEEFVEQIKRARTSGVKVASGVGKSARMKMVRIIERGEKLEEIINEGKGLTYMTGNEHALVKLADGRRALVSGGPGGIDFNEGEVVLIFGHTHPTSAPHSAADETALEQLGQSQQTVFHGGERTKVRPKRFRGDPEADLPTSGEPHGTPHEEPKAEPPQQTAAERDWEKAEAEAKRQEAAADKPERTEHGALREQDRGALSARERDRLVGTPVHRQPDGATAQVLSEGGGRHTVVVVGNDNVLVTVIRNKSKDEVRGLSSRYHWDPPW